MAEAGGEITKRDAFNNALEINIDEEKFKKDVERQIKKIIDHLRINGFIAKEHRNYQDMSPDQLKVFLDQLVSYEPRFMRDAEQWTHDRAVNLVIKGKTFSQKPSAPLIMEMADPIIAPPPDKTDLPSTPKAVGVSEPSAHSTRDAIIGKEMPEDKLLQRTPPKTKPEARLYKEFIKLFPFHPFSNEMGSSKKPMEVWKSDSVQHYLKELWSTIQKNTSTQQVPVKGFSKLNGRDLQYLAGVTRGNLTMEEVKEVYLSPLQYWMYNALNDVMESRPVMTASPGYLDLTSHITDGVLFKEQLSDIAFYLWKALKDTTPDGFKKFSVDNVNFDAIRIYVALAKMTEKEDVEHIHNLYKEKPERFKELVVESVDMDDFDIDDVKEGHGGAGAQLGEKEDDAAETESDTSDEAGGAPLPDVDEPEPQNNLVTAAKFDYGYSDFMSNHYSKYSKALSKQQTYDIFARANDTAARLKAADRSSLVDGTSPDIKFSNLLKKIIVQ